MVRRHHQGVSVEELPWIKQNQLPQNLTVSQLQLLLPQRVKDRIFVHCVSEKEFSLAQRLLSAGASINGVDEQHQTVLHHAIKTLDERIIAFLFDNNGELNFPELNVNITTSESNDTLLHLIASDEALSDRLRDEYLKSMRQLKKFRKHESEVLVNDKPDFNLICLYWKQSLPLHRNKMLLIYYLTKHMANPNQKNSSGLCPHHIFVMHS